MNNPTKMKIDNETYEINTDFRMALRCNEIALDKTIGDYERALAIVYTLLGEKGLDCKNQNKALELCLKYLSLGKAEKGVKIDSNKKYSMNFEKCKGLISSSFKFDYNYDPYELKYLHWYDFYNDLENLSTSEFGTCCPLNRIMSIIDQKPSEIKDNKNRKKLIEVQKMLIEKYCDVEEKEITDKQVNSAQSFYSQIKLD